jgi:glycosyltransferase involved in cell wall biosynthesis
VKVGLNLVFLGAGAGGVGRYAVELARSLAKRDDIELHVFASRDMPREIREADWLAESRVTTLPVSLGEPPFHVLAQMLAIPSLALARRLDVLHSPANAGPVLVPGLPCVVTMHDLIWLHESADWGTPADVRAMRRMSVPTVRRATRVLADSEHAASDLVRHLGVRRDRLDVAPLGVRAPDGCVIATPRAELDARLNLADGPVLLCVAQKRRYKHQAALIRAVAAHPEPGLRLVLPGAPTPYEGELRALSASLGCDDRVRFPAWVSDADLEALYARATAFVLASRREGFGLPVLEAMIRGVPVGCSNRASLPEVTGDAALLFDPDDQNAVDIAVSRLLGDPALRADLATRGRKRAMQFTWERTAQATIDSYVRATRRAGCVP